MTVARTMGQRSLCERDRVGAVIVSPENRVVATGYNGPPTGFAHMQRGCYLWCARAQKDNGFRAPEVVRELLEPGYIDCPSLHAEANALMVCDRRDREGGTIFVSSGICFTCAKLIANSGLHRVVVVDDVVCRSYRDVETSYALLKLCGLSVEFMGE